MTILKFIDLFAGIGGLRYGLEQTNYSSQYATKKSQQTKFEIQLRGERTSNEKERNDIPHRHRELPSNRTFECIYSNEWNKYARQIYQKHYGECDGRDIRTVPTREIPDHDLLCAGFPCQSFSVAGKRKGFEDTRGTFFFEIARILNDKRPRYFLLENVKGLLSHQEGKTFQTILGILSDMGYRVEWQILNSKYFGVPQNRERVFIIGHSGKEGGFQVFPIGNNSQENDDINIQKRTPENEIASTLTIEYAKNQHGNQYLAEGNYQIRRLTPIECERLQGFEDRWTEGISDTQRYKCLGNAVTTNVVEAIGRKFINYIP